MCETSEKLNVNKENLEENIFFISKIKCDKCDVEVEAGVEQTLNDFINRLHLSGWYSGDNSEGDNITLCPNCYKKFLIYKKVFIVDILDIIEIVEEIHDNWSKYLKNRESMILDLLNKQEIK